MSVRVIKILVAVEATLLVATFLFAGGAGLGLALPRLQPEAGAALTDWVTGVLPAGWLAEPGAGPTGENADTQAALFRPFWQAWDIVHDEFVDQPVDDTTLMQGAIRGMMDSLGDEHSAYMDQNEYDQANISLEGSYEGIGAWVDTDGDYLTIISAMAGSPAEAAGLEPGDQVIAIDGEDMTGVPPQAVIRRVMGPEGTTVLLTIRREGAAEPFDVQVTRGKINVPSVESRELEQGVAYIGMASFGDQTVAGLRRALQDRLADEPKGLILDLRGNGGGYLAAAVDVASEFIDEGVILTERFGDSHEEVYRANGDGLAVDLPLVILIDGGSASASEIVAGAVQDHGRGWLVGQPSFGKGSVQNGHPLNDQSGAVRVTIARWYTPDGRSIEEEGLLPDVAVEITQDDITAGRDPQLDKAIELLLGESATVPGSGSGLAAR
jgi:carboxyl-terminal processing protease